MSRIAGAELAEVRTLHGLIGVIALCAEGVRTENKGHCTEEELRLRRTQKILEEASAICDCRHRVYTAPVIRHAERLAWEISCTSQLDEPAALDIHPLVLFLK